MSADLVAFVRARLDEDEELARQAAESGAPRWDSSADPLLRYGLANRRRLAAQGVEGALDGAVNAHHARHDPARVLRRTARDRAVLDTYAEVADMDTDNTEPEYAYGRVVGLGFVVRQMAAERADHPNYKPSWNSDFTQ